MCVCLSVCNHFLLARYLQKLRTNFDEIIGEVGRDGPGTIRDPRRLATLTEERIDWRLLYLTTPIVKCPH